MRAWHFLVFVVALVVSAAAFAPMHAFAPQRPGAFTYRAVTGSIWRAEFVGAQLGPFDAGVLRWRLSPWDLAQGRFAADMTLADGALRGDLRLAAGLGGERSLRADTLELLGARLTPLLAVADGRTTVRGLRIRFVDGRCADAAGMISSDVLSLNRAMLAGFGPPLSGEVRCVGEDAEVALAGQEGGGAVSVIARLRPNGGGEWRAMVRGVTPETATVLAGMGLGANGEASIGGDMRWLAF